MTPAHKTQLENKEDDDEDDEEFTLENLMENTWDSFY